MKKFALPLLTLAFFSCSSPRYTYNFSHYREGSTAVAPAEAVQKAPLAVDPQTLTADVDVRPVITTSVATTPVSAPETKVMTRKEKRTLRKEIVQTIREQKAVIKADRSTLKKGDRVESPKMMDHDLKLAAIFGAVGIVALLIPLDFFWILGGISLLIGVVFFVMWLSRQ